MNLFNILKQFKNIEPDAQFTERVKREILLSPQTATRTRRSVHVLLHVFETSAAVVLAGLFILVLTGNFLNAPAVSPIQYAVIDPTGLHAEAQAIDMQIQLANIDYPQQATSTVPMPASTAATGTQMRPMTLAVPLSTAVTSTDVQAPATPSSTSSSSITIDQALQQLSQ